MRKLMPATCLSLALAAGCYGQTFEVASIKVRSPDAPRGRALVEPSPGNLVMRDVGMNVLMMWAFKIGPAQISNGQALGVVTDRFDVIAKAAGPAKTDELRIMLQNLLKDRFKLAFHRETKEVSAYALVEAKGGNKLKPSDAQDGRGVLPVMQDGKMALTGQAATLDQLTMFLTDPLRVPVVDQTGLKGRYDFEFDLTDFMNQQRQPGEAPPDPVAMIQTALSKQVGLRLEAKKLPIEMLVIDHVEKLPTEN
jgi:uncharacterized protein (TIGR03435 family)